MIDLDESLIDMLSNIIDPEEDTMFNPFVVGDKKFTVEYIKQDGSPAVMTGTLFIPDTYTEAQKIAHYAKLSSQDRIPVWTDQGWRSFYATKVTYLKVHND